MSLLLSESQESLQLAKYIIDMQGLSAWHSKYSKLPKKIFATTKNAKTLFASLDEDSILRN